MTNIISAIAAAAGAAGTAAAATPPVPHDTNWTLILSVCAVSVAAMTAFIAVFSKRKIIDDDELRKSSLIVDLTADSKSNSLKHDSIKDLVSTLRTDIEKIKVEMISTNKSLDEVKKDNRELVQRLDDLLRQLMELLGN